MVNDTEPAKLLLPYLQRADDLQKHDLLVAYYCRLYAMEKGLKIPQSERTKTTNSLLVTLMNQLEKDKKSLKLGPDDNLHVEGFALNVFAKADKQDRAGRADLNTAKTFYAASIFFEILNQFGTLQPDIEQKQKYAVWKAADIRKALKEGRKPTPGPPYGDDDLSVSSGTPASELDRPSCSSPTSQPGSDPPQFHHDDNLPSVPSSKFHETIHDRSSAHIPQMTQFHDSANNQNYDNIPPPPAPSYPTTGYSSQDLHPPPSAGMFENHTYSQQYHHQPYSQEPQQQLPRNYQSHDTSPYHYSNIQPYSQEPQQQLPHNYPSHDTSPTNYPNFQSYPSFSDSSLPSVPSHHPSVYQGSDSSNVPHSAPQTTRYQSAAQYSPSSQKETKVDPTPTPAVTYQYDSNYQPPPEKIAEAHKAARFAAGALAFDDVSVAVDFLKKSLELLTNPSASH